MTSFLGPLIALGGGIILLMNGISILSVSTMLLCVACMSRLYADSEDLLDFRAVFFLAILMFIALPGASIDTELNGSSYYWSAPLIRNLTITKNDLQLAELLVFLGTIAAAVPLLHGSRTHRHVRREAATPVRVSRRIWAIYAFTTLSVVALAFFQYGGMAGILLYMVSPNARLAGATVHLVGLSSLLVFLSSIAAYMCASRLRSAPLKFLLFLPPVLLVLPAGSRGSFLSVMLIAVAAIAKLNTRRPMFWVMCAAILLPPFASLLFRLRQLAVMTDADPVTIGKLYSDFAGESLMLPLMAHALHALNEHLVDYTYGIDLLMLPLWYFPRALWPTKPMPLDFRLNAALGLNDGIVFGTPIGMFGGLYFNFTMLGYIPACIGVGYMFARLWRRFRNDRLACVLLVTFAVDLVRVGDLSRELITVLMGFGAAVAIRWVARENTPQTQHTQHGSAPVPA